MKLENKVALVTGGGRGIGRGISLALAVEGADVAVNFSQESTQARQTVSLIKEQGRRSLGVRADVAHQDEVEAMVAQVLKGFGRIDILVNNAGVAPYCPFLELEEETWDRTIAVNLKGAYLCSRAVALEMVRQRIHGTIINISSVGGKLAQRGLAHYNASKGGLDNLTRSMALELGPFGIRVNTVAPGAVEVDRNRQSLTEGDYPAQWQRIIPTGRWGQPEEIGRIVAFLASEESAYISGEVICADGGQTVQVPQPNYDFRRYEKEKLP